MYYDQTKTKKTRVKRIRVPREAAMVNGVFTLGVTEERTSELSLERGVGVRHADGWGNRVTGRRKSMCNGPAVGHWCHGGNAGKSMFWCRVCQGRGAGNEV